jgi:hypothetical protein
VQDVAEAGVGTFVARFLTLPHLLVKFTCSHCAFHSNGGNKSIASYCNYIFSASVHPTVSGTMAMEDHLPRNTSLTFFVLMTVLAN